MDFKQLVLKRYSCRHYSPDPINDEDLKAILEAARLAPTAANRQPFQIILIRTEKAREDLLKVYNKEWFVQPPLVLCVCCEPEQGWRRRKFDNQSYAAVDAAIVVDHITLQAADLGLGTCWIGAFDPTAAREFLQLPEGVEPIAFTPLGYPLDEAGPKTRKSLEELIRYDTW